MTLHIGRKFSIALAKETTRGTAAPAAYWVPKMELSWDDKINTAVNDSSYGIIEDSEGQDVVGTYAEGEFGGRLHDVTFGLLLLAALGTESSTTTVQAGVIDHTFTVSQNAQHQSLTISTVGPNENSGTGHKFTLAMLDQLDISMEVGKYTTYKASFQSQTAATASNTIAFTAENYFLPQHGIVKIATTYSGLTAASAISIRKAFISIKKNIDEDRVIGSLAASDRLNQQLTIEGSLEIVYNDRSYVDTIMVGDLTKALRLQMINTAVTIGSSSNPTLTIDLAKVKISEVARKIENNTIVVQTIKFKAFYSITDTLMISTTLRNTHLGAY